MKMYEELLKMAYQEFLDTMPLISNFNEPNNTT